MLTKPLYRCAVVSLCLFTISLSVQAAMPSYQIQFASYKKNIFEYEINYNVIPTEFKNQTVYGIFTQIKGPLIQEENTCYLSAENQLLYIYQKTMNQKENTNYIWEIENHNTVATALYHNQDTGYISHTQFPFPSTGYSLQALTFILLEKKDIRIGDSFHYKLLIPPDKFFDIDINVLKTTSIRYQNAYVECFQIELALAGILGLFTPKYLYWVSQSQPHRPIQYTFMDQKVVLKFFSTTAESESNYK